MSPADWRYPEWKAPADDGGTLIWPEPAQLLGDTLENRQLLSSAATTTVQNVPLAQLRAAMRRWIGHDDERPLLATGHQSELYHPGVWVKDVLIHHAAGKLAGQAYHFAVDTDHPKHLGVRWPGGSIPITDDPALGSAAWAGLLAAPTPQHVRTVEQAASDGFASSASDSMLFPLLDTILRMSLEPPKNLAALITNVLHQLDWRLGLRHHALLVSPLFSAPVYLAFVHHLMARADAFAVVYNSALAEYRARTGTKNRMRPMPDLFVGAESVEVPFWLDDLSAGARSRPSVFRADGKWLLELLGGERFIFDPSVDAFEASAALGRFLAGTSHRLSPRALTLTLFLRLFVADQFVHGIGGGRYDRVTDQIIAGYFGLTPPRFAVTTATLFFPGAAGRERVCMPCLLREGHKLRHAALGLRKRELIEQIASLPRRSSQRQQMFLDMHHELRAARATSVALSRFSERLQESDRMFQEEQVLFDRELFYATQSRDRLEMMIDRYRAPFT